MRQGIVFTFVLAMSALVLVSSASASADRSSCPSGFTQYAVPDDGDDFENLGLDRIVDGLNAVPAPYTVTDLLGLGNTIDGNNDGQFCLKAISNLRGNSTNAWAYFYGARDNDTAAG